MDFTGRFETYNGLVIAIHPLKSNHEDIRIKFWGHELWATGRAGYTVYYYDELGRCKEVMKDAFLKTTDNLGEFDLIKKVNPQSLDENAMIEDCCGCLEYQKGKVSHAG